jgi:hypothetical protein
MIMSDNEPVQHTVVSTNVPPTVNIIGCGGAGINMVRRVLPSLVGRANHIAIDTSTANLQANEEAIIIGGGGSGLVRSLSVSAVAQRIASLTDEELELADINIVVFSLSGGSGSVIGPLLISDIAQRRKRLVIALTIASSQSEKHTDNTLKTLQSLRMIVDDHKLYLPITIYDNVADEAHINRLLPYKLDLLLTLLTASTIEVDKHDRMHWINVPKMITPAPYGLRLLYVKDANSPAEDARAEARSVAAIGTHIHDSLLAIHTAQQSITDRPRARVSFEGQFVANTTPLYGVIGNPPKAFEDLMRSISHTLNEYRTNGDQHEDPFADITGTSNHGLVL